MSKSITFSLTFKVVSKPTNVSLFIDGKDPIEMKYVQNNNQFIIYDISLPIDSLTNKYPNKLFYNYVINGALVYENNQQLILAKKPLANIFVNDTTEYNQGNSQITILFYIRPPITNSNIKVVYLKADTPVFDGNESQIDTIQMHHEGNYYLGIADISVYLNQPIFYKYYINDQNGNELLREKGRMHTLYIHSSVPNKEISIYDIWNSSIPYLSFYPQVIVPHQTPSNQSTVSFEYSAPDNRIKTIGIGGNSRSLSKIEPFYPENCWRRVFQMPREDTICNYSIGASYKEGVLSIDWSKSYNGDIVKPSDFISSRILFEPNSFKKYIGVYIPLVSIRENRSQPVGDFKTLVSLAKWCRSVHIGYIHVHIERIHHGLLDPIHADGINWPDEEEGDELSGYKSIYKFRKVSADKESNEKSNVDPMNCSFHASHHGGLLLPKVREEKIKALYKRFLDWNQKDTDKSDFNLFLKCNDYIAKHCNGIFEQWVQFTLFNQLENAFEQIFETGVQLITDISVINPSKRTESNNVDNDNNNDNDNDNDLNNSTNSNDNDKISTDSETSIHINSNNNNNIDDNDNDHDDEYKQDLINEIRIASRYSHSIMIVGLCPHSKQLNFDSKSQQQHLTIDFVRNLFGDIAQNVIDTFFGVSSFSIRLLDNAFIPKSVHNFASKLNSNIRDEFEKNMQMIISLNQKNENTFILNDFQNETISQLKKLVPMIPSSLILDQMSCEVLGPENVSKMNILPYSSIPIQLNNKDKMQCLGPVYLSPEMVSEFPSQTQAEIITGIIKQRIQSNEQYVEFYFTDLLRALGYDTDIEPIQTIKYNCRFMLQFTIQDLFRESETSDKIRALLASPDRGLI